MPPTTARHHAEWLSLIEVSGPFLSMPVLLGAFPQGLDAHDTDHMRRLRLAHEEWEAGRRDPAIHNEWVRFILGETLRLPASVVAEGQDVPQTLRATIPEHGETLRPDAVVRNPDSRTQDPGRARMLVRRHPPGQDLNGPIAGLHWKASPATRMMELLHATDVRLGLVTNGEHWMLVDAPRGETTGYASWYASLWLEEPVTLRAFRSLLSVARFFSVPEAETLEGLFAESAKNQQDVTDRLGYQVRRAVEVLIQELDRSDQDHGGELLSDIPQTVLYEAALTVMMRLVFLFCAEERGLLLLGDPVYDQFYAVSTMREQLREAADQHGEEVLERRHDAWCRILSTFRAVYGGVNHERMTVPAYAGNLFNPDRFPFLEGRPAETRWTGTQAIPLPVNNRTVLHLLESLQMLEEQLPGGGPAEARRLSFRALDIEQIGHVYEGLLDHTAVRAREPILGLAGTKNKEPEVRLTELEELAKGDSKSALTKFLKQETGRSESALGKALAAPMADEDLAKLRAACGNDQSLLGRVLPFSGLVRMDTFGRPVVVRSGSVFVTAGTDRRSSGTHYTPRSLTEPIVQHTLEPLVYVGPAEGTPKEGWKLRSVGEILELKVCDMACGSGAFLVQACRYLSERLLEAWETIEGDGSVGITPEGKPSQGDPSETLIPANADERMVYARRIVAQRCLYGVDINPLAVEMAKLSLWLLTMAKDRPFTFLDHAIRHGDSLLGIRSLDQLRAFSLDGVQAETGAALPLHLLYVDQHLKRAAELRREIAETPSSSVDTLRVLRTLLDSSEEMLASLKDVADILIAAELGENDSNRREDRLDRASVRVATRLQADGLEALHGDAQQRLNGRPTFHWPLEFPEVFSGGGGFHAFVCNPPFAGGRRLLGAVGEACRDVLPRSFPGATTNADLVAFFYRRAYSLMRVTGALGMVGTKSIAESHTCDVGLRWLCRNGGLVYRATSGAKWPGTAGVLYSVVHILRRGPSASAIPAVLDGKPTETIGPDLRPGQRLLEKPARLAAAAADCSQGTMVYGDGFVLSLEEATGLVKEDARNKEVLSPYLNGQCFNTMCEPTPGNWIINFGTMEYECAQSYAGPFSIVEARVRPDREALSGQIHEPRYWLFWDKRERFYERIAALGNVLVCAITTKYLSFVFYPAGWVFSHALKLFAIDDFGRFCVLQSSMHEAWARTYSSSLGTTLRYSTSAAFDTFVLPLCCADLDAVGERYHEHRRQVMLARQEGLTKTYNRFHDQAEGAEDIARLRALHVEMDHAVAEAYGWSDLDPGHGFHETAQGVRYTICEDARREVLDRLLALNHERYQEEVAQGLHDVRKTKKKPSSPSSRPRKQQTTRSLFAGEEASDE